MTMSDIVKHRCLCRPESFVLLPCMMFLLLFIPW